MIKNWGYMIFLSSVNFFHQQDSQSFIKLFLPNIYIKNSPDASPYISLKNELREFDKRSKHSLFGDQFITYHNLAYVLTMYVFC